ncbi:MULTISPECIES: ABC transporter ATP-binding protein [unclassified Rothia (in: high G+C Gram-positive bacteria)]|uniref:ABC transporter ATP-binding protein n=1 Tax=unclassified Rothia (in: high G+C Gram-positive bacteria) TaxID=2689056 RepID=UPI00195BB0F4|nr:MULTISPECIES: ABC transporter ATP-binding protein [unclassified Rothia (in: high G+C Gram-positive bacteria)]MBM7052159.1 ABC transporter ATP-binding protein [Rothia sp. ZJ1223]QRZ61410.1 ABC transporter ATP-binding protein [Rothia sp. ZJ932]
MNTKPSHISADTQAHYTVGDVVLQVRDLSVDFGVERQWVPAAMNLNYEVRAGEVLAIVGESGSGKSVSSMGMIGLLPKNARVSGSVKLDGKELIGLRNSDLLQVRGDDIAVIFQEPMTALNPVMTVGEQIIETLRLHKDISPAQAKEEAINMLELVEMPDPIKAFNSYPHQMSGGQRQRAMIAQSLSTNPKLLIADEPTTALDVTVQAEILDLMRNLQKKLNSAIILITHDMGVVADLADRVAVMRRGEIVETGDVAKIFANPQHEYTQALLGAVLHLGGNEIDVNAALDDAAEGQRPPTAIINQVMPAPERTGEVILSLNNVSLEYPKQGRVGPFRAVSNATLDIRAGEVLGLVGESGSGKSTIGRATVGFLDVAEGELTVCGHDMRKPNRKTLAAVRKDVGMVFQDPSSSLNPRLPIGESIGEPMFLAGVAKGTELQKRIETLLDRVELPRSYRNRYPHELSGGQKQRVGIARALSLKPKLLIADEPTSALDVSVQARVLELFQELQEEMGFACLFVTHDLAVIDELADRIAVMRRGEIVEQGTREQILRHPKQAYTQRLLAAVPLPNPDAQAQRRELRAKLLEETGRVVS